MKRNATLISQVLALNLLAVTTTLLVLALASGPDLSSAEESLEFLLLTLAILLTLLVNMAMRRRRFSPLERLIERVEAIDPSDPRGLDPADDQFEEVARLAASFRRLLGRIEAERRRSGSLVLRAQEEERKRVARDLHDEVNQALTAILLRLEALSQDAPPDRAAELREVKLLANRAMRELLDLARQLRPAALDDHGLVPAVEAQLRRFTDQTGVKASLVAGETPTLGEDGEIAIYRVVQEALSNVGQHAGASRVEVELAARPGEAELRVSDDGGGFDASRGNGGLGLSGMAERARLVGGSLEVRTAPGSGSSILLRVPTPLAANSEDA